MMPTQSISMKLQNGLKEGIAKKLPLRIQQQKLNEQIIQAKLLYMLHITAYSVKTLIHFPIKSTNIKLWPPESAFKQLAFV